MDAVAFDGVVTALEKDLFLAEAASHKAEIAAVARCCRILLEDRYIGFGGVHCTFLSQEDRHIGAGCVRCRLVHRFIDTWERG